MSETTVAQQSWDDSFGAYCDEPAFPSVKMFDKEGDILLGNAPGITRLEYFTARAMRHVWDSPGKDMPKLSTALAIAYATLESLFAREYGERPQ